MTALDWAAEAMALLARERRPERAQLEVVHADWRAFAGSFDLVLGADLLYERRNAEALLELLPQLAPEVLLAEPAGRTRPSSCAGARATGRSSELGDRVYRLARRAGAG